MGENDEKAPLKKDGLPNDENDGKALNTKAGVPARAVFIDKGLVLKRVKASGPDVVTDARSSWLRTDNLKLDKLEPKMLNLLKSILLAVEFKVCFATRRMADRKLANIAASISFKAKSTNLTCRSQNSSKN